MAAALATILLGTLLAAGGEGAASERAATGSGFELRYQRSGGFVGTFEDLRIRPRRRGILTAEGGPRGETVRFTLSRRRIDNLRAAFREAGWSRLTDPGREPGCADCFLYVISYNGRKVEFDSATFPERLAPVVRRLDSIVEDHRPLH